MPQRALKVQMKLKKCAGIALKTYFRLVQEQVVTVRAVNRSIRIALKIS